ncbi:hypothetical protein [Sphaerobacter thermophilus]|uniref:Uncharacterized protein n=1 Tax=Sphaerobacter thermophilus (strain ATCC 49802 / DSM 20745 / KCCM 41009 / NCIMB 13125 / S 6022) TaxID=479434 RepID=D1C6U2_SPHTD|nr:hypothetical protein [Sphaerobacter thermophilus]ACZ37703.1 hypothetical protein Sthe_0264 [Sphaerobacter thermophilus DSM 20745]
MSADLRQQPPKESDRTWVIPVTRRDLLSYGGKLGLMATMLSAAGVTFACGGRRRI